MAQRSLFWTDGVGDGGPYSQDQLRLILKGIGGPATANEGVVGGHLNGLRVTTTGNNNVTVDTGRAIDDGTLYENDASLPITTASPTVGTTGRRVVLQKSWAARTVRAVVISSADGVAAIPALTQIDGTTWEIPLASFTITTAGVIGALTDQREFTRPAYIEFIHEEAGAALSAGIKGRLEIPADIELVGWTLLSSLSGTIQYDIWVDTYANYPPTVADTIAASAKPNLSSQNKNQGTAETWTKRKLARGDILIINVDSTPAPATVTSVVLVLRGFRA